MYSWGTFVRDGGGKGLDVKDDEEEEGDWRDVWGECMDVGENRGRDLGRAEQGRMETC